jgi:hypothetical protein
VNIPQNVGPNELRIVQQQHQVNIAQKLGPNELCIVLRQHQVNIAQNVGLNELHIVPQQHPVNIPQNARMNELCIISYYVGTSNNLSRIEAWLAKFTWQFALNTGPVCISLLHGKRSEIL